MTTQNRLADMRSTVCSLDDAKAIADRIALAEKALAVASAKAEKRIADLKHTHAEATLPLVTDIAVDRAALAAFIVGHPHLFQNPRTVKTDLCKFGLQQVTDLIVHDQTALLERLMDLGYDDCMKVSRTPVKTAIKARMEDGETFPGCTIRTGDTAICIPHKAILDQAKQEAVQ